MTADLAPSWASTLGYVDLATNHFWSAVDERCPGLIPEREAGLVFAGLGRLTSGGDDPAGRAALLAVLGRAYRRCGLLPPHHVPIGDALLATVARFAGVPWTRPLAAAWQRADERATRTLSRCADQVGAGPAWWPAEVIGHDRAGEGITVLTVRPHRRLPYRPGQAMPVCTPRWPGRWRWYSPANAPHPDGTIELHVRAVPGGSVSGTLVHAVRPGDPLWLGPPGGGGLLLDPYSRADLLLIAGGTGLAPLRALVEHTACSPLGRRVTLVVGARTFADLYDPITLDKLQCAHDWLTIVPAFSHDLFAEPAERGDALTVAVDRYRPRQQVYVCGPPAMLAGSRLRLLAAGVPADHIHLPDTFNG